MSELLTVQGLCKSFLSGKERLDVLADLSLHVSEGEMVAVTGVSGSGKSTLLHLLGAMDRPDQGKILFSNTELSKLSKLELSRFRNRSVGFVFQFHYLLPEFTALENVSMPLLLRGESRAGAEPAARRMLEEVGLGNRTHHRPGELSGGEQQRVALARALIAGPRLLLADEPTGNLDPHTGETIGLLLKRLHASHNLTSVLVTHNEKLARICSPVYRLEEGKLLKV